jgi:hypothetical protein
MFFLPFFPMLRPGNESLTKHTVCRGNTGCLIKRIRVPNTCESALCSPAAMFHACIGFATGYGRIKPVR